MGACSFFDFGSRCNNGFLITALGSDDKKIVQKF